MIQLVISLLGPAQVLTDGGRVAAFNYHKARALLAYLAVEADRAHTRDTLAGLLWPDLSHDAARVNLRQSLADVRQAIGDATASPPFLQITRDAVQFNVGSAATLDVAAFNELVAATTTHSHRHIDRCPSCAARLEAAVALYRGEFLAELSVADGVPFEEWAVMQRERLHRSALDALTHLAGYYERRGMLQHMRCMLMRILELDPWREEVHRTLMEVLARSGQRSAALHQYEICRRTLAHELDVAPDAQTTALYLRIRDGSLPLEAEVMPRAWPGASLPQPPTPLVGREEELAQLDELLANRAHRLITVHGPGGIGKTRLALAAGVQQAHVFEHGVVFVPLETVTSVDFLAPAILAALDIPAQGQRPPFEQLRTYLHPRELLLILDNFEHLVAGAGLLVELLQRAPGLTVLVTSQVRLAVQAESLFQVHGLRCPPAAVANLHQFSAASLLLQRIQPTQGRPVLNAADTQAVVTICHLMGGVPLALVLAAAAVRDRSLPEVAAALTQDLRILEAPWSDTPARHANIWAVLEYAWRLLSSDEYHVFSRLAVLRGGFQADAAFEIAGATLPVLRALIDKSLLQREPGGRYTMHNLVRPFAAEKLRAGGQSEETARRHLAYFMALAETAESELRSAAQDVWLARLELDYGNIQAALSWAQAQGDDVAIARLSSAVRRYWHRRGRGTEGRGWLKTVLDRRSALPLRVQAKALYSLGVLDWHQGIYAEAHACLLESVVLWRAMGESSGLAYALSILGRAAEQVGDHAAARRWLEESQALFRQLGDDWGLALALFRLGYVRTMAGERDAEAQLSESLRFFEATGDRWGIGLAVYGLGVWAYTQEQCPLARARLEQAVATQREIDDRWLIAVTLNVLGDVARCQRDYDQAERAYRESLDLFSRLDSQGRVAAALANLGHTACARHDLPAAQAYLRQGLELSRAVEDPGGVVACLAGLAGVLSAWGQPVRAVRLLALTTARREAAGAVLAPADRHAYAALVSRLTAQLDAPAYARAWEEGQGMTVEEAVGWVMMELGRDGVSGAVSYEI
jgi:DNA-binding SARP family transcriptional activator/predicted ATPase